MTRRCTILLTLATVWFASPSPGCEIRVRDSAFRSVRDLHKLCIIANSNDSSVPPYQHRLNQWLENTGGTLNLEVVRVDADDPATNWQSLGIPSSPPSLPVTVLIGRDNGNGENFVIDHYEPVPSDSELAVIADSPVRQRLARELAQHVAVLIFAPRDVDTNSPAAERVQAIVDSGIADERIGLSMIRLDRTDPAERLLCRFMGLRPGSPDTLCVAFGRGKLMSPPLTGDQIDADNVDNLVTQIRQACSCSQPLPTMGVDVPLLWSGDIDSSVVLMDQELDLSELETEVQNMLAAKTLADANGEPSVIPIPPGRRSSSPTLATNPVPQRFAEIAIGMSILLCGGLLWVLLRRRSPVVGSQDSHPHL